MGAENSKAEEKERIKQQRQENAMRCMLEKLKNLETQLQSSQNATTESAREATERNANQTRDQIRKMDVKNQPASARSTTATRQAVPSPSTCSQASRNPISLRSPSTPNNPQRTEQQNTTKKATTPQSPHQSLYPNLDNATSMLSDLPKAQSYLAQNTCSPSTSRATNDEFLKSHGQTYVAQNTCSPSTSRGTNDEFLKAHGQTYLAQNTNSPSTSRATNEDTVKAHAYLPQNTCSPSTSRVKNEDFVFVDKNRNTQALRFQPTAPPAPELPTPSFNQSNSKRDRSVSRTRKYGNTKNREENELNCRSCQNKYGLTIFQCQRGHSSCRDCKMRGVCCGVCGDPITDMRNITLEAYIAEKTVPCPNSNDGCHLVLKLADIEFHLKECPFNDLVCPVAALIGGCSWRGKISQMPSHFQDDHPQNKGNVDTETILFNTKHNGHSLQLVTIGTFNFLVHFKVSHSENMIYMVVQLLGTGVSASKWTYELQIYNKNEPRRKFQYTDTCCSHSTPVKELFGEAKCATIPLSYADSFGNFRNSLTYKFYIRKNMGISANPRGRGRGRGNGRGRGYSGNHDD